MNKLKTVKEVCDLTGLTRKHLYYFHHQKVVRAAAYSNYSVEGNDGYKLYDDAALEKLQQIALYYQLGLKRDQIRDMMLRPDYDSDLALKALLDREHSKIAAGQRRIAALEYIKRTGTGNRFSPPLCGMSLEELGETLLTLQPSSLTETTEAVTGFPGFAHDFEALLQELSKLEPPELERPPAQELIGRMFSLSLRWMGKDGPGFVLGYFAASLEEKARPLNLSPLHSQTVFRYFLDHPELCKQLSPVPDRE